MRYVHYTLKCIELIYYVVTLYLLNNAYYVLVIIIEYITEITQLITTDFYTLLIDIKLKITSDPIYLFWETSRTLETIQFFNYYLIYYFYAFFKYSLQFKI